MTELIRNADRGQVTEVRRESRMIPALRNVRTFGAPVAGGRAIMTCDRAWMAAALDSAARTIAMLLAAGSIAACAPGAIGTTGGAPAEPAVTGSIATTAADTLRGTVRVVGSQPGVTVVLEPSTPPDRISARAVTLDGERAVLEQLAGMEVVVIGDRESVARFHVDDVAVRAVSGVRAVDGILEQSNGAYVIVTREGERLPVAHLPAPLQARVGERVWIAGPLAGTPEAYGVIR